MKKLFFAVLALFVVPASAADLAGPMTKMDIVQVAPGVVDLKVANTAGVWLVEHPNTSKKNVLTKPDESGKGDADVVMFASDPKLFQADLFCWTGVGPNWAKGKSKFNVDKMSCTAMGNPVVNRITVGQANFGSTFGILPVVVNKDGALHAWGSHPFGDTRHHMKRPDGTTDVITLLTVEKDGSVRPATKTEAAQYQADFYAKIF